MKISLILAFLVFSIQVFAARVEVEVEGMTCGMCVSSITKELKALEKVDNVSVNLEDKKARFETVKGKWVTDTEIKSAIKKAGYKAAKITRKQ